jgi:catechol 2,3-dioxygenase-like lactoylglutathione lyase family enzyme
VVQINWQFDHVGMMVTDLDKGVAHFQRAGFVPAGGSTELIWPGASTATVLREQLLRRGVFGLKLQQTTKGIGLPTDYLAKHGEGINYFGFKVNDLATASDQLAQSGFPVLCSIDGSDGNVAAVYHDTREAVDIMIALFASDSLPLAATTPGDGWRFEHAGLVVSDMCEAIKSYEAMGFDMFLPPINMYAAGGTSEAGLAMSMMIRSGFIIEIMQTFGPRGDEILWGKFLKATGGGVNHLHFAVDDLDGEKNQLEANGFTGLVTAVASDGRDKEIYFNTNYIGNVQIGLYRGAPRLLYQDTMNYLLDAGIIVGRAGMEQTSRVSIEPV